MPGNPPDRRPANSRPSATPRRYTDNGPPVAGAPGWYVVRRKSQIPVLFTRLLRRRPRFGFVAVPTAAGVAILVLLLSLVRAHSGEAPAERSAMALMPPVASSPGAGPDRPPAASAEAPAVGATPEPDAPIEKQGGPRGASAIAASRAKADPAPHEETAALLLVSRQTLDGLTPEWQSPSRPPASVGRSQAQVGSTPSRAQVSSEASLQFPSSPQAAAGPARHGSTPKPQVAGEVPSLQDRPALSPGDIRIFIHFADHRKVTTLAERLADHLRRHGFTVVDIQPVDFTISKPSVRYFFEGDRSASERLVEELSRSFEEGTSLAPDHASDFTHYLPKPRPGTVEVWLPASPLAAAPLRIATAAEEQSVPTWMTVDADAHKVTMDVAAGFNPNNSNWNFNGYYDGDMTVVVPEGWQVEIILAHRHDEVPHSLVVMADPGADNLPLQAGREQAAFPRGYSRSPEQGISAGDQDTIAFKTNKTGDFLWFCGVPGHGQSGMWTRFVVTGDAETPYITITADAEPGRG
jgi:sulfocyanin